LNLETLVEILNWGSSVVVEQDPLSIFESLIEDNLPSIPNVPVAKETREMIIF